MDNWWNSCDRCGCGLEDKPSIMSMYNEDILCLDCKKEETKRPDYKKSVEADMEQIKQVNWNFEGIGLKPNK